jgi:spore coat polysaccharide biosynthesis predicted glycosyltransferase SpsG
MIPNKKRFIIISVSLQETGRGHFVRSINLYNFLKKKNLVNFFIIDKKVLKKKDSNIFFRNISSLIENETIIILDLSNIFFFKTNFFFRLFNILKKFEDKIVIVDSIDRDSILNYYNFLNPIMIYPYIISKKSLLKLKYFNKNKKYLTGSKYFISNIEKKIIKKKKISRKILVSCGGSDKENCTLKIINFFYKHGKFLKLICVIGDFFEKENILKIKNFIKLHKLKKNVKLLFNIKNLPKIFGNYRVVISTSGLTKYEVLAYGLPSIVITPNKYQEKYHYDFSKKKICLSISSDDLDNKRDKILNFINNSAEQKKMKKRAKNLIDLQGAERVEKILISHFK